MISDEHATPAHETVDGKVLRLYDAPGQTYCTIAPDEEDVIRHAMRQWAERRIDKLLELTTRSGARFVIAASRCGDLFVSTRATRALGVQLDKLDEDETSENRQKAGYVDKFD